MISKSFFVLETECSEMANKSKPGNFFQLMVAGDKGSLLRVPISIYEVQGAKIYFLIKIVGKKTKELAGLRKGDFIDLIGPLGNSFPEFRNKNLLFVSGGVGYAPLFFLKEKSKSENSILWLHGGRSKDEVFEADKIYTDNGEVGIKGLVTLDLIDILKGQHFDFLLSCGPKMMMEKCCQIAQNAGVKSLVSLEEYMACGIGACLGCAVSVKNYDGNTQYKRVCKDGPVFNGSDVVWNEQA